MYNISKISRLHIELSSKCNAACPACSRNYAGGPKVDGLALTELTLDDIKNFFPDEILKNILGINFCGNFGDPGTARDLLPILKYFQSKSNQNLVQQIRSNGGMRNPDFWFSIGEFFSKLPFSNNSNTIFERPGVVFSVDGLEDTNHIYRRGVKWEKLFSNMKAYSESGAYGVWEFLVFEHNQHQLEEAQKIAESLNLLFVPKNPLGFGEWNGEVRGLNVYNKDLLYEYTIYPRDFKGLREEKHLISNVLHVNKHNSHIPTLSKYSKKLAKQSGITCKSLGENHQEIYVSHTGHLLPCCFLGGIFDDINTTYSRYQFNTKIKDFGLDNIDLRKNNLVDILSNPNFSKFFLDGWKAKSVEEGKLLFCTEICGSCSSVDKLYTTKTIPIIKK